MTWVSVSSTKHVVGSPSAERFIAIIAEIHEQRTSWKSAGGGCIDHDFMLGRAPQSYSMPFFALRVVRASKSKANLLPHFDPFDPNRGPAAGLAARANFSEPNF